MEMSTFFHAGGPVRPEMDCYIRRKCEKQVEAALFCANPDNRQFVTIVGPRQVGKTSLLVSVQTILKEGNIPNVSVNLSSFRKSEEALWYNQLAERLHNEFGEDHFPYQDMMAHDSKSFTSFLGNLAVVADPNRWGAVILLDEVASVPPEIAPDFFSSLRTLYDTRFSPNPAGRFIFIFAGAFYPDVLYKNKDNSPFNVSRIVEVPDFERDEVEKLLKKGEEKLHLSFEPKAVDEIWDAARGHPLLTQEICQDLVLVSKPVITPDDVKKIVDNIVYKGRRHMHLSSLVSHLKSNPEYTQCLYEVLVEQKKVNMTQVEKTSVERIDALMFHKEYAYMRNKIYKRYLSPYLRDPSWLNEVLSSKLQRVGKEERKEKSTKAVEVFYSYAHQDEALREVLEKHLRSLQEEQLIVGWYDRKILAGQEWKGEIDSHLNTAQIILLLVSPDFLASGYCFDVEVKQAMKRHEHKEAHVIPILLRQVDYQGMPFGKLQVLPVNKKPVTSWSKRDEAFFDIARGIRKVVENPDFVLADVPHLLPCGHKRRTPADRFCSVCGASVLP